MNWIRKQGKIFYTVIKWKLCQSTSCELSIPVIVIRTRDVVPVGMRQRTISISVRSVEIDFLIGVYDETRMGGVRFSASEGGIFIPDLYQKDVDLGL